MGKNTDVATEYRKLLQINDPIKALDECRSAFRQAKRGYRRRIRTLLGMTATMNARVSRDPNRWERFTKKKFWQNCSGEKLTMADRPDGLRFVVRYAENAVSRPSAQNASKHAIVIRYLLQKRIKPGHIPRYLSKRGQGITPTYAVASAQSSASVSNSGKISSAPTNVPPVLRLEATSKIVRMAKDTPVGKVKIVAKHLKQPAGGDRFVVVSVKTIGPAKGPSTKVLRQGPALFRGHASPERTGTYA